MPATRATGPTHRPAPRRPEHARLVIRLFGEGSATMDGHPLPELAAPRMQQLLARLTLACGTGVPRNRLATELWPDSSDAQARTNLRKLLHDLRRSLPDAQELIEASSRTVRWCPGPSAWVDVVAFVDALDSGNPAEAVRGYGGDLLPGRDGDWMIAERERLRHLAIDALAGLAAAAGADRRDADVVEHTRHLLRIDPLHEPGCRLLMRALARRGERSEALRTYETLTARLTGDLGVAPEPATTKVAEQLRDATRSAHAGPALVGRDAELRAAHQAWREAAGGLAQVLLVTGEAGIGKSRLVEELARTAAAERHAVAYSRAYQAAGRPPWGPTIDWLRSAPVRSSLDTLEDVWLAELARLLPELRTSHPELPDPPPVPDAGGRHRLLDAIRRGLLAGARPLLLVVDDLQWCDPETVELCGFLVQSTPSAPVLVAGTVRDEEVTEDHSVARLRRYLSAAGALSVIALGPLDQEATTRTAALVGRRPLTPEAASRLWAETEGNPLFVVEAIRAGFATGASGPTALSPTVHAVITARLDRLPPGSRRLAEVAATIGREFTTPVLAAAAARSEDDMSEDLDELWRQHIVRVRGPAYDFSHDRLREVALESISPARRRKLHRRVAEALEAHYADDLGPVSARLAAHYASAGLGARALDTYERAAQHAYRLFALDDCITLLLRALRMLGEGPRGAAHDEVELRLLSAIGVPLVARHGYAAPEVQRCYARALTLHRKLGRHPSPSVLRGLALHAVGTCRFDRAEELGRELLTASRTDHTAGIEGEYVLGVTRFWRGEFAAAEQHLAAAIDRYRIEDAPLHVARYAQDPLGVCLSRLALTQLFRGRPTEADRTMRDALRVATELDNPMTTGYVRAFDAIRAALEPRERDLTAAVARLDAVTSRMHIGYFAIVAQLLAGWRDVLDGDHRGIQAIHLATAPLRREQPLHLTLGLSLLASAYHRANDPAAGRAVIAEALDATARSGQRYLLAELLRVDAELLALMGDPGGAAGTLRRAVDTAVEMDAPWLRDRALSTLSRLSHDA